MNQKPRFKLPATVQENCIAESSDKHTPSVQLSLLVGEPPQPELERYAGTTLRADLWLTPGTVDRTFETLGKCFGWYGDDVEEINNNRALFAGKKVVLVCEIEEWEGQPRVRIAFVNPAVSVFAVTKERAAELAQDLNGALARFRKRNESANRTAADLAAQPADAGYSAPGEQLPF